MRLISVVMGVDTIDNRTSDTVKLLNYGFNNYKLETIYKKGKVIDKVKVEKGKKNYVDIVLENDATELLNNKDDKKNYMINIEVDKLTAPLKKGDIVGEAEIIDNEGNVIDIENITVKEDILKANLYDYFKYNLKEVLAGKTLK